MPSVILNKISEDASLCGERHKKGVKKKVVSYQKFKLKIFFDFLLSAIFSCKEEIPQLVVIFLASA
jgi:hypothetical protein